MFGKVKCIKTAYMKAGTGLRKGKRCFTKGKSYDVFDVTFDEASNPIRVMSIDDASEQHGLCLDLSFFKDHFEPFTKESLYIDDEGTVVQVTLAWMKAKSACSPAQDLFNKHLKGRESIPTKECIKVMMTEKESSWARWLINYAFSPSLMDKFFDVVDGADYHPGCTCDACSKYHEKFSEWLETAL